MKSKNMINEIITELLADKEYVIDLKNSIEKAKSLPK